MLRLKRKISSVFSLDNLSYKLEAYFVSNKKTNLETPSNGKIFFQPWQVVTSYFLSVTSRDLVSKIILKGTTLIIDWPIMNKLLKMLWVN